MRADENEQPEAPLFTVLGRNKIGGNRDRKPVLARYAANRRRFGGRRGLRHHQMSRRFGWSHNHAGP